MKRTSLRISDARLPVLALACLTLWACGQDQQGDVPFGEDAQASEDDRQIECALDGADVFTRECTRTLIPAEGGDQLIIEAPDGSFRRFVILTDGRGLDAADGAESPRISLLGDDRIQVVIGGDRYMLPARIKAEGDAASVPNP